MEINKMTLKPFKEYEALMAKATPGPWAQSICSDILIQPDTHESLAVFKMPRGTGECSANVKLTAAAVNALPELIAVLREARECFEYLQRHKLLINSHAVAVVCSAALKLSALEGE